MVLRTLTAQEVCFANSSFTLCIPLLLCLKRNQIYFLAVLVPDILDEEFQEERFNMWLMSKSRG